RARCMRFSSPVGVETGAALARGCNAKLPVAGRFLLQSVPGARTIAAHRQSILPWQDPPNVHYFLRRSHLQMPISFVGNTDNYDFGAATEFLLADEVRILHVFVRVAYVRAFEAKYFTQLVGKRIADVIGLRLESHSENADFFSGQGHFPAQLVD